MLDPTEQSESDTTATPENKQVRAVRHNRVPATMRAKKGQSWRAPLEAAAGRAERYDEYMKQHGPVKILMKDGKPVDQS